MSKVNARDWLGLIVIILAMGLLLFAGAGTVRYWQAWAYLTVFFVRSLLIFLYLVKSDPALLRYRASGDPPAEKQMSERVIETLAAGGFLALMVVPAVDHRLGWSTVPVLAVIAGDVLTALAFTILFFVNRESTFTSTIEVAADQELISTGPFAVVRHPMYAGTLLLFIGTPIALGSYWALLMFVGAFGVVVWRLINEERFLAQTLPGYVEYSAKVRRRLMPGAF